MGLYKDFDMNYQSIKNSDLSQMQEVNMFLPRLLKDNVTHYSIDKIVASQSNHALITED